MDEKVAPMTVQDIIDELRKCPPDARVMMFSDEEGNECNPVSYVGLGDGNDIVLVPMHSGWERYMGAQGGGK